MRFAFSQIDLEAELLETFDELVDGELASGIAQPVQGELVGEPNVLAAQALGHVAGHDIAHVALQKLDAILVESILHSGETALGQIAVEQSLKEGSGLGRERRPFQAVIFDVLEEAEFPKRERQHLVGMGAAAKFGRDLLRRQLRRRARNDKRHFLMLGEALADALPTFHLLHFVEKQVAPLRARLGHLPPEFFDHGGHRVGREGGEPVVGEVEVKQAVAGNTGFKELAHLLIEVERLARSSHAGDDLDEIEPRGFCELADDFRPGNKVRKGLFARLCHKGCNVVHGFL